MSNYNIKGVLIDGDLLVYRCGFAVKEDEPVENALHNVKAAVNNILDKFSGFEYCKLFLTGKDNFRKEAATIRPYKGNRKDTDKPKYYNEIREYMIKYCGAEVVDGREADDALACAQWSHSDRSTVIVSIDKDLNMVPGLHFNYVKDVLYDVSLDEANLWFFKQMLIGDTTDNIQGVPKLGPKTADKLLDPHVGDTQALMDAVKEEYRKYYKDTAAAAFDEMATLLWMQREEGQACPFTFN